MVRLCLESRHHQFISYLLAKAIEAPMLAPTPAPDQSVTTKSPKPERGARKDYTKRTRDYPPTQPAQAVPPTSNVFLPPSGVEAPSKPFARPVVARDSDEDEVDNLIGEVLSTAVQEKKKPKRERSVGDLNLAGTESSRRRRK